MVCSKTCRDAPPRTISRKLEWPYGSACFAATIPGDQGFLADAIANANVGDDQNRSTRHHYQIIRQPVIITEVILLLGLTNTDQVGIAALSFQQLRRITNGGFPNGLVFHADFFGDRLKIFLAAGNSSWSRVLL